MEILNPSDPLGERLKAWRLARGLSMAKAARLIGVHPETLAGVERGGRNWIARRVRRAIEDGIGREVDRGSDGGD